MFDYRVKENIVPMENAIDRVKQLKPSRFNFIVEPNIKEHNVFKLTNYQTAAEQADIIAFLVAHDEFKALELSSDKVVLDFCGIR